MIIVTSSFSKGFRQNVFDQKEKPVFSNFQLRFEEHFRKAAFLWRIIVDGRPNPRNKAAFSNFSGVACVDGASLSL